jgi:spore germination protein YaaH
LPSPEDGANYVKFLKMVRDQLPEGKTLSVAMPASYWYLRGFHPITEFEKVLDYVIYMTYDLHGQWDYDNPWAVEGCPAGNCLRSHVNIKETKLSRSML